MFFLNVIVLFSASVSYADSVTNIIYGEDSRVDTFESSSSLFRSLAKSTAAQVHRGNIKVNNGMATLTGRSVGDTFRLCRDERFYEQPVVANCSGFLVAPDLIVSAGHCFETSDMCSQYSWIFDFKVERSRQRSVAVPLGNIYRCKEILAKKLNQKNDFAIIRLDREVTDRSPVKIGGEINVGTPLVLIGHPSGLPQKIAADAIIKSRSGSEFKANLDAFQINSGSAVFNAITGSLLGILVSGQKDYRTNNAGQCTEVNTASDNDEGETISSYLQFKASLDKIIKR